MKFKIQKEFFQNLFLRQRYLGKSVYQTSKQRSKVSTSLWIFSLCVFHELSNFKRVQLLWIVMKCAENFSTAQKTHEVQKGVSDF